MISTISLINESLFYSLSEVGHWIQGNLSVEGLIALPALMTSFLIALAIYNFEDSKKGLLIDASTIMTQVVRVPRVIWSFMLISGVVVFFEVRQNLSWTIPLLTIVYLLGLLLLVQSLQRSYQWARSLESNDSKNIRTIMRTKYLANLRDEEKISAWEKIWQADDDSRKLIDQRELVRLFIESIREITPKNHTAASMVRNFTSAIDTMALNDPVIMDHLTKFCLSEARGLVAKPTKSKEYELLRYTMGVRSLFIAILNKALESNDHSLYSLIHSSREYLSNKGLDESHFVDVLATNLLDRIKNEDDKSWAWDNIPDDWKVTTKNLENTKNRKASLAMLNAYSRMLNSLPLYTKSGELNTPLQTITAEILPDADPILWAKLFSFHWSPYGVGKDESSEHAQVRNYLENHLSFGFAGHTHTQYGEYDADTARQAVEREEQEVIDIAVKTTMFGFFHDDAIMKRYFAAIRKLKKQYADDEKRFNKLIYLESILKRVQKEIHMRRKK